MHLRRGFRSLALALLAGAVAGTMTSAPGDSATRSPASATGLSLLAPPGFATPMQPFTLRLSLPSSADRASGSLALTLYRCLQSRSQFDATVNGGSLGPVAASHVVALAPLPVDASDTQSGADLTVAVQTGPAPAVGAAQWTVTLTPASCPQSFYGIYPLRIQLIDNATSSVRAQLVTYIVYTQPTAPPQPLRLGLLVPLTTPLQPPASNGTSGRPSDSQVAGLQHLVVALGNSHVPLTLMPNASTVKFLLGSGTRDRSAITALSDLVATSSAQGREIWCGTFANADAGQLVASGLATELTDQVAEAASVIQELHYDCATRDTWISEGALDQASINELSALGYRRLVVPRSSLSGPAPSYTPQCLFGLGASRSQSVSAVSIDPGLSSRLQPSSRSDSALAADQFVTELEQIYFDAPNFAAPRGVVALAPWVWTQDPSFVEDVLGLLEDNPMVKPVTLESIFAPPPEGLPLGCNVGGPQPALRRPVASVPTPSLPTSQIRAARARLSSFSAAVSTTNAGRQVAQALDQALLLAESSSVSARQQKEAVTAASSALGAQLRSFSVSAGQIRLASNAAPVPITILKTAPYQVTGVLGVKSDKLVFPRSSQSPGSLCTDAKVQSSPGRSSFSSLCTIGHGTNVVYVDMRSRATGDFRVTVTLTSPRGGLVLASAHLTVRSMSISSVSIALSVAAAVVLLAWWGRTAWTRRRGRRPRRPAHARRSQPE